MRWDTNDTRRGRGGRRGLTAWLAGAGLVATVLVTGAWTVHTPSKAEVSCDNQGNVVISANFSNKESSAKGDMNVTMKTSYGNDGPKVVAHKTSANFSVNTGKSSIPKGTATFKMTWVKGSGSDSKEIAYDAKSCHSKVWVCKYVGKPGVDERLKEGKQPISVSVSSTGGTAPGSYFSDAQGRSYVLGIDDGKTTYSRSDCPQPEGPPTSEIDIPAQPSVDDPCGPNNATWNVPADTDVFNWTLKDNGHLVVNLAAPNTKFKDGTTSHDYGVAPDSGEECPVINPSLALAVEGCVGGEQTAVINGKLTEMVEGVEYTANMTPDTAPLATPADENGNFQLLALSTGLHKVMVTGSDGSKIEASIEVKGCTVPPQEECPNGTHMDNNGLCVPNDKPKPPTEKCADDSVHWVDKNQNGKEDKGECVSNETSKPKPTPKPANPVPDTPDLVQTDGGQILSAFSVKLPALWVIMAGFIGLMVLAFVAPVALRRRS